MTLRELCDIAGRIPMTADGVPIWPGMMVYRAEHENWLKGRLVISVSMAVAETHQESGMADYWTFSRCYSTPALAVAAREKEGVQP